MVNPTLLMIFLLEEQLALLEKHIAFLKSGGSVLERSNSNQASLSASNRIKNSHITFTTKSGEIVPKPVLPAKAPTAFTLYTNQNMMDCQKRYPYKNMDQLIGKLGKLWTFLPAKEKRHYTELNAILVAARQQLVRAMMRKPKEEDDDMPVILGRHQKEELIDGMISTIPKEKTNDKKRKSPDPKLDLSGSEIQVPPSLAILNSVDTSLSPLKDKKKKGRDRSEDGVSSKHTNMKTSCRC